MMARKEWFETWFDSPYYHILYDHRNVQEAEGFILNLRERLQLNEGHRVLDLGCGAGRHAAFLAGLAGEVVGVDLSANSISHALSAYKKPNLEFYTHDMRLPFRINYFSHILNFFTSFGYFKRKSDNIRVLESAWKGLQPGGMLLIDFMNAEKEIKELKEREEVVKQGISFYIRREIADNKIVKHIKFDAEDKVFAFSERVQAIGRDEFRDMLDQSHFILLDELGDYQLNPFNINQSPRYILLAQKPPAVGPGL